MTKGKYGRPNTPDVDPKKNKRAAPPLRVSVENQFDEDEATSVKFIGDIEKNGAAKSPQPEILLTPELVEQNTVPAARASASHSFLFQDLDFSGEHPGERKWIENFELTSNSLATAAKEETLATKIIPPAAKREPLQGQKNTLFEKNNSQSGTASKDQARIASEKTESAGDTRKDNSRATSSPSLPASSAMPCDEDDDGEKTQNKYVGPIASKIDEELDEPGEQTQVKVMLSELEKGGNAAKIRRPNPSTPPLSRASVKSESQEEIINSIREADRTMMIEDPFAAIAEGAIQEEHWSEDDSFPKLIIVSGDHYGQEFPLRAPTLKVGRFEDSDLCIRDDSVSRNHAEIIKRGKEIVLADLGSLNGTRVNNKQITEQILHPNDQIKFGDVLCHYIAPGDIFTLDARDATQIIGDYQTATMTGLTGVNSFWARLMFLRYRYWIMGVIVMAVIIIGALFMLLLFRQVPPVPQALTPQNSPPPAEAGLSIPTLMEQGFALYQVQKWTEAKQKFEEALALAPNNPKATEYLLVIDNEIQNSKHLDTAKQMMKEEEWPTALLELQQIPAKSQIYSEALHYIAQCQEQTVQLKLSEADNLYSYGDYIHAKQIYEEILKIDPSNERASQFRVTAEEKALEKEKEARKKTGPKAGSPAVSKTKKHNQ
jgi:tetratricopeptide (TPR) repeat protein